MTATARPADAPASSSPSHPAGRAAVNALAYVGVLVMNALAGSGRLSGRSVGALAEAYPNYFLPAGWTFSIWSLIYLGLGAFVVYQALPGRRHDPVVGAIGWAWVANAALNVGWITTFSFGLFLPALLIMVALLANLVVIGERIGAHRRSLGAAPRILVAYPFMLYLGWISVALIANVFHYAHVVEWSGFGVPGVVWSPIMMGVAVLLGVFLTVHRGAWIVPLVVAWALVGIRARHVDVGAVAEPALVLTVLALLSVPLGLWWRKRREGTPVPA